MKHARSNGLRIHYQDSGMGQPLVVLNGWSGSGLIWPRAWVADLGRDFRLLRVDNRGTGWSDPVEAPFTMADMAADVLAVLDAERIDRAHVFGLSMGGMIAQTLAIDHADRVQGLVLAATAPPVPEFVAPPAEAIAAVFRPITTGEVGRSTLDSIWTAIGGPGFAQRGARVLAELVEDAAARPTPLPVIMLQYQAIGGFRDPERLRSVRVPTLVLHGVDDPLLPVENGRRLHRLLPDARYEELPGVGHLVPWEAPERTAELMREVLL